MDHLHGAECHGHHSRVKSDMVYGMKSFRPVSRSSASSWEILMLQVWHVFADLRDLDKCIRRQLGVTPDMRRGVGLPVFSRNASLCDKWVLSEYT